MSSTSKPIAIDEDFRKILQISVAALIKNSGFESCHETVLETLTEMIQSYIIELGRSSRTYCEVAGRSMTTLCDIETALVSMGCKAAKLIDATGKVSVRLGKIAMQSPTTTASVLKVGTKAKFPAYVSTNLNFPPFPDPHTYMRTLAGHTPESDYSILRENESAQKWNIERALTRFIAKTGNSHALLSDDKAAYPLISANTMAIPYLNALLPSESETRILSETSIEKHLTDASRDDSPSKKSKKMTKTEESQSNKKTHFTSNQSPNPNTDTTNTSVSHNPYLRSIKKPKRRKIK